jgi:hypothetical protein
MIQFKYLVLHASMHGDAFPRPSWETKARAAKISAINNFILIALGASKGIYSAASETAKRDSATCIYKLIIKKCIFPQRNRSSWNVANHVVKYENSISRAMTVSVPL